LPDGKHIRLGGLFDSDQKYGDVLSLDAVSAWMTEYAKT
jgi:hypothetical protein